MTAISMEALSRMTTVDLLQPDTAGRDAGSTGAFNDYLQQAHSQDPRGAAFNHDNASPSSTNDSSMSTNSSSVRPWAVADSSSKPTELRPTAHDAPRAQDATRPKPANTPDRPRDKAQTSAYNGSSSTTSPSGQDGEKPSSGNQASTEDMSQSSTNGQHDTNKPKQSDPAAVVLEINTNSLGVAAAGAAQTAAASGNSSATNTAATAVAQQAKAAAATVQANASAAANATNAGATNTAQSSPANVSQTAGTKPAAKEKYTAALAAKAAEQSAAASKTTDGNSSAQAATPGTAATASSATLAGAASVATSAAAPSGIMSQTAATVSTSPSAATTSPLQSPTPTAAPAVEPVATLAATNAAVGETSSDVLAAKDQRAKSAIDALTSAGPDNDVNSGLSPSGSSSSTAPVAASTSTNNPGPMTTGTTAAHSAETNLSQADRVRFVQRVEQAFQDANSQGGSVRLRLSPPDLGSLKIEIKVTRGEMTARVEADTPSARNLILDNLPDLRDRLAQHDIKVQRFDVDLMDRSGNGLANQSPQQQTQSWQNAAPSAPRAPALSSAAGANVVETSPTRPASGEGRLNVVV
jgi:flagellar hook-length control protein FliK